MQLQNFLFVDVGTYSKTLGMHVCWREKIVTLLLYPQNVQSRSTYELLASNPSSLLQHTNDLF